MKTALRIICGTSLSLGLAASTAFGQSNTFPASGNVGIGISPSAKLHVRGETRIERRSGGNNHFLFNFDAGGNYFVSDDPGSNHKHMYLRVLSNRSGSNKTNMYFQTGIKDSTVTTRMTIRHDGNIGIGTTNPQAKLAVNGNILAKEVKVKTDISVPDYVFESDYELPSLAEIEAYVKQHKHLPEVPSAADIQRDGLDLAAMNLLLLKKVEELTLHMLRQEARIKELEDLHEINK
ncbi:hypothetical protein SAMN05421747_13213 [Parapedobacter composti]|uniref:Chaperone of endosialidase n=1 Tax=Parapedobacter composti TaxID=623281 RepID=A0A1I1MC70_9SPHI|nr:hypothetical protein [Parapedobacter composti]SFC82785.1 hypothetical protein SAMN05421747_13213 [Parapedobacter composti]